MAHFQPASIIVPWLLSLIRPWHTCRHYLPDHWTTTLYRLPLQLATLALLCFTMVATADGRIHSETLWIILLSAVVALIGTGLMGIALAAWTNAGDTFASCVRRSVNRIWIWLTWATFCHTIMFILTCKTTDNFNHEITPLAIALHFALGFLQVQCLVSLLATPRVQDPQLSCPLHPLCTRCGYLLHDPHAEHCSECGQPVRISLLPPATRPLSAWHRLPWLPWRISRLAGQSHIHWGRQTLNTSATLRGHLWLILGASYISAIASSLVVIAIILIASGESFDLEAEGFYIWFAITTLYGLFFATTLSLAILIFNGTVGLLQRASQGYPPMSSLRDALTLSTAPAPFYALCIPIIISSIFSIQMAYFMSTAPAWVQVLSIVAAFIPLLLLLMGAAHIAIMTHRYMSHLRWRNQ